MNKKIQTWLPLLFSVFLVLGMFLGYKLRDNMGNYAPSFWKADKQTTLQEAARLIAAKYVDTLNADTLTAKALEAMLAKLDPYSTYIPADDLQRMNDALKDNFDGIGVAFQLIDDTVTIMRVLPEGPSAKAGLQPGDQLIAADGRMIAGKNIASEAVQKIFRGKRGSKISVKALRDGKNIELTLTRDVINAPTIETAYMIAPETGFIKLDRFSNNSYESFMQQLEKLQQQGMKKLVLDLRDNGGGLLEEAVQIADELIGNNQLILYTEGKASPRQNYLAKRPGLFEEGALVVLIDEGSASASEVLAAAVQDWDRGTIVGRNSFGKGLVQEQFNLSDGSAMRLSVSRYYTPLGRNLQKPFEANQNKDAKTYRTRKGKTLYAQSGIAPDVLIASDSTLLQLRESMPGLESVMIKTALRFYQQNKNSILTHKTPEAFSNALRSEKALQSFLMAAIRQRYPQQQYLSTAATEMLTNQCCAMIAGIIWGSDGSVRSLNSTDPFVQKARSLLLP